MTLDSPFFIFKEFVQTPFLAKPTESNVAGGARGSPLEGAAGAVQRQAGGLPAAPHRAGAAPRLARRPHTFVLIV